MVECDLNFGSRKNQLTATKDHIWHTSILGSSMDGRHRLQKSKPDSRLQAEEARKAVNLKGREGGLGARLALALAGRAIE
eukprot:6199223-Pleurochrysis_carterae.AAC.1